jgi:hypothetical protein
MFYHKYDIVRLMEWIEKICSSEVVMLQPDYKHLYCPFLLTLESVYARLNIIIDFSMLTLESVLRTLSVFFLSFIN